MDVALTGVTGVIGRSLAARMANNDAIDRVRTLSRRPLPSELAGYPKIEHYQLDFTSPETHTFLSGADALVHAAFQCYGFDLDQLERTNVGGSIQLIKRAAEAEVTHVTYFSSMAAYGSNPDNPVPIAETTPLRPTPSSWYSVQNAAVERWLDSFASEWPEVGVLRVRPSIVLSQNLDQGTEAIKKYFKRFVPYFKGDQQVFQFVQIDDACEAITTAVVSGTTEALNIAGDGWQGPDEVAEITGGRPVALPRSFKKIILGLNRIGLSPIGKDRIDLARDPIALDNGRMTRELGITPRSSQEALEWFMAES